MLELPVYAVVQVLQLFLYGRVLVEGHYRHPPCLS